MDMNSDVAHAALLAAALGVLQAVVWSVRSFIEKRRSSRGQAAGQSIAKRNR